MKCPFCGHNDDKVIDSRSTQDNASIRRRRECLKCSQRFTTYEYIEKVPLMVIKKDDRREPFSRNKILDGVVKSCQKRPISMEQIEELVDQVEREVQKKYEREVEAVEIGEMVIAKLSRLDGVAYVRFASVYRQFKDVNEFMRELRQVLGRPK
jgi:transcriptional repressor NrdR